MKHFVLAFSKKKKKKDENPALFLSLKRKQFANRKIPPNKTDDVTSCNVPTLRGAVVFVSVNPGEPDALLGLVREDQLGRRVGSLCEHNQRPLTASDAPQRFSFVMLCFFEQKEQMMDGQMWCRRTAGAHRTGEKTSQEKKNLVI